MLLALGLIMINKTLRRFANANNIDNPVEVQRKPLWKAFVKNQFLLLVVTIFFLLASAYYVFWIFNANRCRSGIPTRTTNSFFA